MRLRLPSRASSWAKTAAKPAVSSRATGTRAIELAVPGRRHLANPLAARSMSSTSETASSRERRSWPVTASAAPARQRGGLDRARRSAPRRARCRREARRAGRGRGRPGRRRRCRGTRPGGCRTRRRRRARPGRRPRRAPSPRVRRPRARRLRGQLLAALLGRRGGGAAAHLGRRSGRPPRRSAPTRVASSRRLARRRGGVFEAEGERGDVVAPAGAVGLVDQRPHRRAPSSRRRRAAAAICSSSTIVVRPSEQSRKTSPGAGGNGLHVDLDLGLGAERAGDDRALRVVLGLGVGELALAAHLLDQRVVAGEPLELAAAQAVGAAVADVADRRPLRSAALTIAAVIVVPIPAREGSARASSWISRLAASIVSRRNALGRRRRAGRGRRRRRPPSRRPRRPGRRPSRRRRRRSARGRRRSPRWRCAGDRCRCGTPGRRRAALSPRLEPELGVADPHHVAVDQLGLAVQRRRR